MLQFNFRLNQYYFVFLNVSTQVQCTCERVRYSRNIAPDSSISHLAVGTVSGGHFAHPNPHTSIFTHQIHVLVLHVNVPQTENLTTSCTANRRVSYRYMYHTCMYMYVHVWYMYGTCIEYDYTTCTQMSAADVWRRRQLTGGNTRPTITS